jgi:hypothetical protein
MRVQKFSFLPYFGSVKSPTSLEQLASDDCDFTYLHLDHSPPIKSKADLGIGEEVIKLWTSHSNYDAFSVCAVGCQRIDTSAEF